MDSNRNSGETNADQPHAIEVLAAGVTTVSQPVPDAADTADGSQERVPIDKDSIGTLIETWFRFFF